MRKLFVLAALAVLTAACGGGSDDDVPEGGVAQEAVDFDVTPSGYVEIVEFSFPEGLDCVAVDGMADCDFDRFRAPASWRSKVGEVADVRVNGYDDFKLYRTGVGALCVFSDNGKYANALNCGWPAG